MLPRIILRLIASMFAFGACVVLVLASGCSRGVAHQKPPAPAAVTVTVAPVEQKEVVEWNEFTGRIEPVESVEVRPRISGYIQEVRFQSGQLVKKGDILVSIDPRWHQAEFDRRHAEDAQAKVRLENAKREADRTPLLLANRAISIEESEARQARFHEAQAASLATRAALDSAKLDLEYTQVRAPIDGRVSRALLTEGNYVSGVAGGASVLTTIVSVDPIYVHADIDENSLLKFNALTQAKKHETNGEGKIPVELQLTDEPEFRRQGHIESFDNRLDPKTGSILLRAVFPNSDGRIVPGLFARIRVPLSERHSAVLVEERAIGTDQAQKFVLSLTPTNTVAYRAVKLGPLISGKRVVRSGLDAGEMIVVNGLQRVRPGMPVTPQTAIGSTAGRSSAPSDAEPYLFSATPAFPSPRPSPQRRGRHVSALRFGSLFRDFSSVGENDSLSLRERAGVRGKETPYCIDTAKADGRSAEVAAAKETEFECSEVQPQ